MIEIVSHGNQIRRGKYFLHSKFTSAVNFCYDDSFVFVVNKEVGSGPLNIVVQGVMVDSVSSLEVGNDSFYLNGKKFRFDELKIYDSKLYVSDFNEKKLGRNLRFFESTLIEFSPTKSLAFLLDENRKKEFTSSFEIEYIKQCENAVRLFLSDDFLSGIKMLKGLGPGLTPSGDDFISGVLIALNLRSMINSSDNSNVIEQIYETVESGNHFTTAFLRCSAKGFLLEKFKRLIDSLLNGNEDEIIQNTRMLFTIGATSGADQAVGFLIGIKRFIQ
ncbi:MAG: DUF2877 domain-containing protein [Ignavibacteriales bacterium]|nr:DUF2877 domain-containing protein [Ignavibacteriales bacterium]